jgi:hypothetical protein
MPSKFELSTDVGLDQILWAGYRERREFPDVSTIADFFSGMLVVYSYVTKLDKSTIMDGLRAFYQESNA